MKEAGYVYILTNPSFKEDWVKIGKSSRSHVSYTELLAYIESNF